MKEAQELVNKFRHLKQYANLSDDELLEKAKESLFSPEWVGLKPQEVKQAKKKYRIYKSNYSITNYSDLMLLGGLIYNELLVKRYKNTIKEIEKETKSIAPPSTIRTLGELEDRQLILREKLGLLERNKKDKFTAFLNKAKQYWKEKGADQSLPCPYCGEMIHFAPNMKYFELHKFPFLKSRVLYNEPLIKLYEAGKLTAKEAAGILYTNEKYFKWIVEEFENANKVEKEIK